LISDLHHKIGNTINAVYIVVYQWLTKYTDRISQLGVFDDKVLNHVLVNEYEPGQGIMVILSSISYSFSLFY